MNLEFYYKGQSVSVKSNENCNIKKAYDLCLPKFNLHINQELKLFGNHVRLRLKRSNVFLSWKDVTNTDLFKNDTIMIEPNDNALTNNSKNCHAPKRYDISNIENNYSGGNTKQSDSINMKSNMQHKSAMQHHIESSKINKYQKSDQSKEHNNAISPFDRNGFRRSLGAAFAPQTEFASLKEYALSGSNTNITYRNEIHSSDSSISDLYPRNQNTAKRKVRKSPGTTIKGIGAAEKRTISKSAPASPTKPAPPMRSPHTHLSMMNTHNVRTIGKKINLTIFKKPNAGLGFTIVTRDNPVLYGSSTDFANSVVILVNKILKNGGAADDGRLKPGDRLLEVNSVPVSSLKEATDTLRAIPENTSVDLLISRIDNEESVLNSPSTKLPKTTSQLTFEISITPNNKESQQLGLNILYLSEKDNPVMSPGIYIHSILVNSYADQQGGLQVNDKLIGVNGRSLSDISVEDTIALLKIAMQNSSVLALTVTRESSTDYHSKPKENNFFKPAVAQNEGSLKNDINPYILPQKFKLDKSKHSRHRAELKNAVNTNQYSSTDSVSQQDTDPYNPGTHPVFSREGQGRRSMSEKRKAHEDATQYNFYKATRDGVTPKPDVNADRLYSTLPTSSRLKKMQNNQSPPPLPNKSVPVKPSQIKLMNVPKSQNTQESAPKIVARAPSRSTSLRDSPNRPNIQNKSQSPKRYSQTPTHELQPVFNRAMNNSFRKAVQKSLPDTNDNRKNSQNEHSTGKSLVHQTPTSQSEKEYQNYSQISAKSKSNSKLPRSSSVKTAEKKKSFNIKDFLKYTPNSKTFPAGKSDTFPPDKRTDPQLPNYQTVNTTDSKQRPYSPIELPAQFIGCTDQAMIDSAKRVLEWHKKNDDVISKENKTKDNKTYQPINLQISSDSRIQKPKTELNLRNVSTKSTTQYHYETDPYDTIDATLSSPTAQSKPRSSRSQPRSVNNPFYNCIVGVQSTKNGSLPQSNSVIPYQTNNNRRTTSIGNDIYATVNKPVKKESSMKPVTTSNISQLHKNNYKF